MGCDLRAKPSLFFSLISSTLSFMFQMIIIFSSVWSFWFGAGTWPCPGLFLDQELFWVMITSNIWLQEWKCGYMCARHAPYLVLHPRSLTIHFDSVDKDDNRALYEVGPSGGLQVSSLLAKVQLLKPMFQDLLKFKCSHKLA